jgi:wyosine [tRNA(Phe)-imidazoG37] synthetase (radical SAM superfamily)
MAYSYLFGPVPSRRLGLSLGVDVVPAKVCNLNCVYCECGKTTTLTVERREWAPASSIIAELADFLKGAPFLDVVTVTGSGEPTLNTGIEAIISFLKTSFPAVRTALLTNGTLFHLEDVRRTAAMFDCVLPSLDAVSDGVFSKVNRPARGLDNGRIIDGLVRFAHEYRGTLWLEVFIVPGVNDTPGELSLLRDAVLAIAPGRVQLNTLDRPGASSSVRPASDRRLLEIAEYFRPAPVEIISRSYTPVAASLNDKNLEAEVLSILRRRPCTVEDVAVASSRSINEAAALLKLLEQRKAVSSETVGNRFFYKVPQAAKA